MQRVFAEEAGHIIDAVLNAILTFGPRRGREGADMRTAIGRTLVHADLFLQNDLIGPEVTRCFDLAAAAGVTRAQFGQVRRVIFETTPVSTDAIGVKHALILLCLSTEARLLSNMRFVSRVEVEVLKDEFNEAFNAAAEQAADDMDSLTYRALIELHGAVSYHLIETARPLPRMLRYQFAVTQPTLVMAQRLYGNAARADELRIENRVIHPAFAPRQGQALSS
jgi:hypothetical protein